ncbi:MAG: 50S ribosomal protein L18 [Burkholderiales bacterium]
MHHKTEVRTRRGKKTRLHIRALGAHRLSVHRTARHIYAQILTPDAGQTLVAASTAEKDVIKGLKNTSNVEAAKKIGATIAARAKEKGITKVAFDRSGFKYHGRVKALADAAREGGLEF